MRDYAAVFTLELSNPYTSTFALRQIFLVTLFIPLNWW